MNVIWETFLAIIMLAVCMNNIINNKNNVIFVQEHYALIDHVVGTKHQE